VRERYPRELSAFADLDVSLFAVDFGVLDGSSSAPEAGFDAEWVSANAARNDRPGISARGPYVSLVG